MIGGGLIGGETRVPSPECLHDWGGLQGTAGDSRGRTWQQIARRVEPDPRKSSPSPVRKSAGTDSTPAASTLRPRCSESSLIARQKFELGSDEGATDATPSSSGSCHDPR